MHSPLASPRVPSVHVPKVPDVAVNGFLAYPVSHKVPCLVLIIQQVPPHKLFPGGLIALARHLLPPGQFLYAFEREDVALFPAPWTVVGNRHFVVVGRLPRSETIGRGGVRRGFRVRVRKGGADAPSDTTDSLTIHRRGTVGVCVVETRGVFGVPYGRSVSVQEGQYTRDADGRALPPREWFRSGRVHFYRRHEALGTRFKRCLHRARHRRVESTDALV